ncbi:MAG: FtsX-like permease family protein [Bacteroidales bacterium]|nr:FtsX-like permease family protein [Bacteroidales bacterium]
MIKNYLKITFRSLYKNKLFTSINILGLATGMAGALLVFLYIQYELNFDRFFNNYDNIYRLERSYNIGGEQSENPSTPFGLAPSIMEDIPSVEVATKFFRKTSNIKFKDDVFQERVCYTDSLFFKVFDFKFITGNANEAIKSPDEIIITQSLAKRYFGDENPMGKVLFFDNIKTFKIAGVIKDIPSNSHFNYKIFAPISDFNNGIPDSEWYNNYFLTFALINKNSDLNETKNKITELYINKMNDNDRKTDIILQNLQEQHFSYSNTSKLNVYLFLAIGIFILILASINYMNLNTAKYIKRTKEVGIRKILGAHKFQLIKQFFGETFLLTIISVFFGILLVETILPYFNQIAGINTDINYLSKSFLLIVLSIVLFSSFLSGFYPAVFLSSFKPVRILKGQLGSFKLSSNLRKVLVIFQFTITTILLISMGFIYSQFNYMTNKNVGFTTDNTLYLYLNSDLVRNYDAFKSTLLSNPKIMGLTKTAFLPMDMQGLLNNINWEDRFDQEKTAFGFQCVEFDFLNTIDYKIVEGRFFSEEFVTDSNAVVINQKAQKLMNYENPIGKKIMFGDTEEDGVLNIIGVVEDFHSLSVNENMEPVMLLLNFEDYYNFILLKLDGINNDETIHYISETWKEFSPGIPFEYKYLDDEIATMYGDTEKTAKAFTLFVIIALLISTAGLFGLSAFTVEQKTKEIGIRKALGASTKTVFLLLNKTFTKWVIISIFIGSPIAYYLMSKWLTNFAYHIKPNILIFISAGFVILFIAQFTVTFHTIKTARANPVDSLRYE